MGMYIKNFLGEHRVALKINTIIMIIHTVTPMTLCFVWPLQSSLPVSSVILVPHPTSPLQYKSHSDTLNMTRYTYIYKKQSPGHSHIFNVVHVTLKMGPAWIWR